MSIQFPSTVNLQTFRLVAQALHDSNEPAQFLLDLAKKDEKLSETFLLYEQRLAEQGEAALRQAYAHYIVNTPEPRLDHDERFEGGVFRWASEYADTLGVGAVQFSGRTELHIGQQRIPCGAWTEGSGASPVEVLREAGITVNKQRYKRPDVIPSTLFKFSNVAEHTLENALVMSDLSELVNYDGTFVAHQARLWGFPESKTTFIENHATDTQAFVIAKPEYAVVCFRGSTALQDWLTDIEIFKAKAPGGVGRVHFGFSDALASVWQEVKDAVLALEPKRPLFLVGHSLGAALAQLAAYRLVTELSQDVRAVYLYGSPHVGNRRFVNAYNALLGETTYHHINDIDIVPRLLPSWLGYHPTGFAHGRFHFGSDHTIEQRPFRPEAPPDGLHTKRGKVIIATSEDEARVDAALRHRLEEVDRTLAETQTAIIPSYGTTLLDTPLPTTDHLIGKYIFKFACAIIDARWQEMGRRKPIN